MKKALLYTGGLCLLFGTNLISPEVVSAAGGSIGPITDDNWDTYKTDSHHVDNTLHYIYGGHNTDVSNWTVTIGSTTAAFTKNGNTDKYYIYGGYVENGNTVPSYN